MRARGLGRPRLDMRTRQSVVFLMALVAMVLALANMGCATTSIAAQYPQARFEHVCARAPGVAPEELHWVYSETNRVVSSADSKEFDRIARGSRRIYQYDPLADPESMQKLPIPHNELTCPERFAPLPPMEKDEEEAWLPPGGWLLLDEKTRCPRQEKSAEGDHFDPRWVGDLVPVPKRAQTGGCMGPGPLTARKQAIAAARGHAQDIGKQFGLALGYYQGKLNEFFPLSNGLGLKVYIKRDPSFLLVIHETLTEAVNRIPALPTYEDPDVAQAALLAFEAGYGEGIDEARLRALGVSVGFEILYIAAGNLGAAAETVGIKALQAALARVRSMPIFVPGTTSGVGFFLRLPKTVPRPPPANANAPSIPPGIAPPPITAPPPFGNLSRAAEFGIKSYNQLVKAVQGTGLEVHHLIEQRFGPFMGADPRMNLTVAVTAAEHQLFTNAWRRLIAYGQAGTWKATEAEVLAAAREVYKDYPAILKALGL